MPNTLDPPELQMLYDFAVNTLDMMDNDPKTNDPEARVPKDILNCEDLDFLCSAIILLLAERYPWIAPPMAADMALSRFREQH